MEQPVKIRKIRNKKEFNMAVKAAKDDKDNMTCPTHILWRNGEIIGTWSLAAVPLVLLWSHSQKMKKEDSIIYSEMIDTLMEEKGHTNHLLCCNSGSPYFKHMEKFGYESVWNTNVFLKKYGPNEKEEK